MSAATEFVYVSCVPGKLVTRFGTGTYIGALVAPSGAASFDPREVVAIPIAEWAKYTREYGRLLRGGDLIERSAQEHEAFVKAQAAAAQKEADDVKAEAGKREALEKKAAEQAAKEKEAARKAAVAAAETAVKAEE